MEIDNFDSCFQVLMNFLLFLNLIIQLLDLDFFYEFMGIFLKLKEEPQLLSYLLAFLDA